MRNTDLENFYIKIDGRIRLVSAFTGDDIYTKIIRSCRLKPYSIFNGDFEPGTKFENHWVDEFGNSLRFNGKRHCVILCDTNICNTRISTDLFFGNSIDTVAKNSKTAIIIDCKYFDKNFHLVALYGQDEYLRAFVFNGKWNKTSPLLFGINTIRELFNNINILRTKEIDKEKLDIALCFNVIKCLIVPLQTKLDIPFSFNNEIRNMLKGNNI